MTKNNLKVVTQNTEEKPAQEPEPKLTRAEIVERVRRIRRNLETVKERYDGSLFDAATDGIPRSLDLPEAVEEPYQMADLLDPQIKRLFQRCCAALSSTDLQDDLGSLRFQGIELGFQIGVLAGIIYASNSPAEIDRAERGLAFATTVRHRLFNY